MSEPRKPRIDSAIIAALIGVCGTVAVTLISLFGNRLAPQPTPFPTWTAIPTSTIANTPLPTSTVPAGEPTSTPAPDTPTPEPTFTLAPPALGEDWKNGCISTLWKPYPTMQTTENNGCLSEPVYFFFADNERLTFLVNSRFNDTQVYGMFAPLP